MTLDQQVRHVRTMPAARAMDNITRADPDRVWTVREVAQHVGIGGIGPVVVGTPEKVADEIEAWFEATDVDGLNMPFAVSPGDFEDIADMLVPELTKPRAIQGGVRAGHAAGEAFRRGTGAAECAASGGAVSAGRGGEGGGVSRSSRNRRPGERRTVITPRRRGRSSTPRLHRLQRNASLDHVAFARLSRPGDDERSRSRGMFSPEFSNFVVPLSNRGRRECRVRAAPAVSCAKHAHRETHTSIQVER